MVDLELRGDDFSNETVFKASSMSANFASMFALKREIQHFVTLNFYINLYSNIYLESLIYFIQMIIMKIITILVYKS